MLRHERITRGAPKFDSSPPTPTTFGTSFVGDNMHFPGLYEPSNKNQRETAVRYFCTFNHLNVGLSVIHAQANDYVFHDAITSVRRFV